MNQDDFYIDANNRFAIIADGMGGHAGGECASRVATSALADFLNKNYNSNLTNSDLLYDGFAASHGSVISQKASRAELSTMGTTLLALIIRDEDGKPAYTLASIGDSRLYMLKKGCLHQETIDDSLVQREISAGRMTRKEADLHPYRHVLTQCVGQLGTPPVPQICNLDVQQGDTALLCTDGAYEDIRSRSLAKILSDYSRSGDHSLCTKLADFMTRGSSSDDRTAVALKFSEVTETFREDCSTKATSRHSGISYNLLALLRAAVERGGS